MTAEEMRALNVGDLIRHKSRYESHAYVVTDNDGHTVTAVRTVGATNPIEWDLVAKAEMHMQRK